MNTPSIDKEALRRELRDRRRRLKRDHPDAAIAAAKGFAAVLPSLKPIKVAAIYHPFGTELDPFPVAAILRRAGVQIVLPVCVARDAPLVFRLLRDGDPMHPDAAGIMTAGPESPEVRPDLIATPLLGFDAVGGRIGQGGGYYDRTLEAMRRQGAPVLAMGLAYAGQAVDLLPRGPHDQTLDAVLTEDGFKRFGS